MRKFLLPLIAGFGLVMAALSVSPASAAGQVYQTSSGTAIDGTDAVAYFTEGRPVAGSPDITYEWNGAEWRFSSTENRAKFVANPERFAPQYGGFCAWAMAQGKQAPTEPEAWRIVDGKLYLNYNKSIQERWVADIPGNIAAADRNWPSFTQ